jgi:hypothetical protein
LLGRFCLHDLEQEHFSLGRNFTRGHELPLDHHYGKLPLCRAFETLSCAFFRAHGKEELYRASSHQRTVKKNARQKKVCRAFFPWRTTNIFPPPTVTPVYNRYHVRWLCRVLGQGARQRRSLCRAPLENARQTYMFAVRFSKAHGKVF